MARIPIAVQLWSVREQVAEDLPGTLAALAKMGYEGVEFAGGYPDWPAEELRAMLDDLGLGVAGAHVGLEGLRGDGLERVVEFSRELGNKFVIVPWMGPNEDRGVWADLGRELREIAGRLHPHRMLVGYHNHAHELKPIGDETPWDIVAAHSSPEVVLQFDLGHALRAGADVLGYLRRYLNRTRTIHLKDYSHTNDKPLIGEGEIPWPEVLETVEAGGHTEWYIVEQEVYPCPPMEAVERCLQFLKGLGR